MIIRTDKFDEILLQSGRTGQISRIAIGSGVSADRALLDGLVSAFRLLTVDGSLVTRLALDGSGTLVSRSGADGVGGSLTSADRRGADAAIALRGKTAAA